MNTLTRITTWAALAWGTLCPLQAASSPQDIFNRLAAPGKAVPMAPEKRAAVLPALALIPAGADMVVALAGAGECSLELMRLLGEQPPAEQAQALRSIGSAAFATTEGADALEGALPLFLHTAQVAQLQQCERLWAAKANPAFADAIHRAFTRQVRLQQQEVISAYQSFHLAPVYYAATAVPGQEGAFMALHRDVLRRMQAAAQADSELEWVSAGGYAGLRFSHLAAYKWLMKSEPQEAGMREAMAARHLYLITRAEDGVALTVLCETPEEITLPPAPMYSMLFSPKLSGADAHIEHLRATAWGSAAFYRSAREGAQMSRYPLALAVLQALGRISALDKVQAHQPVYRQAVQDLTWLVWQQPYFNGVVTPIAVQVWEEGNALGMESVSGAQGMEFEKGSLQYVGRAAAPHTAFYMESTAFSAPHEPSAIPYWDKTLSSLLGLGRGISLTLRAGEQKQVEPVLRYAALFRPELEALGEAVQTICSGMGAPFALLIAQDANAGTDWAFASAVRSRVSLAGGWQRLLDTAGQALGKLGIAPELVYALPLSEKPLGGGAVAHAVELPGSYAQALPQVAVSDSRFVLGNSGAYNAQLMAEQGQGFPFCGAVSAINIPRMAACAARSEWPSCCGEVGRRVPMFLNRLAERVQMLYSVSVIRRGTRTARALMLLK